MASAVLSSFLAIAAAVTLPLCCGVALAAPLAGQPAAAQGAAAAPFARLGESVISQEEFEAAFARAVRGKFYHGKPPEGAMAALQREVAQSLIDEILVAKEAKRRNLKADAAAIKRTIDDYEARYRTSPQWQATRERLLPGLRAKLERDSLSEQLTTLVKKVPDPTPAQLEQYYRTHQDKFTSPEQVHLRMILLKVDPSSPQAKWDGARDEGIAIHRRLKTGADFAQLAHLHSGDDSAQRGGDLGFVHHGMLPEPAQKAIDAMQPGQLSEPVVLLEGIAVFRLEARTPPKLNPLEQVKDRARALYLREKGDEAWVAILEKLRRETPARIDETRFLPLATAATTATPPVHR